MATPYSFVDAMGRVIEIDADGSHGPYSARSANGSIVVFPASNGGGGGGGSDPELESRVAATEQKNSEQDQDIESLEFRMDALEMNQIDFDAPRPEMQSAFDEPRNP